MADEANTLPEAEENYCPGLSAWKPSAPESQVVKPDEPRAAPEQPADNAKANKSVPDGYMRDAQGRLVPVSLVKPEHLLEDALVRGLHARAVELSDWLREFRDKAMVDIESFLDLLDEKYAAQRGGKRGNLTLGSYDGTLRVQVAVSDQLEFGPELEAAKALVDGCIRRWSQGASVELRAIVDDAFNVDKKGKLNTGRILALRRLSIDDEEWMKAMEAIGDAVRVLSSKRYLRLYERATVEDKFSQTPLDLATV